MTTEEQVASEVERIIHRFAPKNSANDRISVEVSFADLGLNSVSFLEMIIALEDRFEVALTAQFDELARIESLGDLHALVLSRITAQR